MNGRVSPGLLLTVVAMSESLSTLADLVTRPDFVAGLVAGLVGLGVLFGATREQRDIRWWGGVFALAALVAINTVLERRLGVSSGLFVLGTGGWLVGPGSDRRARPLGWALIAGGAAIVGWRGGLADIDWLPWLAPVAIVIAGLALSAWSLRLPHNLLGPMIAISVFGIWVTVPETEHARVLLGVAVPMAFATLRPTHAQISTAGAFALAGMVVWVAAIGGDARPGSIIGAWASLGLVAILPLVQPNVSKLVKEHRWWVIGSHAVFVVIASRLIGLWESATTASIAVVLVSAAAYVWIRSYSRRHQPVAQDDPHGPR